MVYIQSNIERTLPHHFDAACALYGAKDNGQEIRLTSYEEVISGKFNSLLKQHLFVGSVEFMSMVFKMIDKNPRIPRNSNREEIIMGLKEARDLVEAGKSWFIKPVQNKLFTGMVFDKMTISSLKDLSENTNVILAYPFKSKILSEWRCYVHYNQIIDIRNYSGNIWIMPNKDYAESVIKSNRDFPDAYVMDIGILETNENVVIEFNDMWAIGSYGVPNDLYLRLLSDRYFEIMRS